MKLIDADALIKWIDDSVSQYGYTYSTDMLNMWGLFKDYLINNAPTIEPEPFFEKAEKDKRIYEQGFKDGQNARPQGEWIDIGNTKAYNFCSVCKEFVLSTHLNFCPNCGAAMKHQEVQE